MRTKVFALLMATTALTAFVNPGQSQTWNASTQWSTTRNPNGAWSYGRRWSQNGDGFDLCSYMYGGTFWLLCGTCWAPSIQAGPDLWANNNANGYPVVRWTCPRTGTYTLVSSFVAADGRGNNNLVWIVVGGSPIFSGHIQAYPGTAGYTNTLYLQNGAYIDFVVAWNGGTPADYNWTVVHATITSVSNVVIQTQPQSQTNVVGSSVQFQVLASGSPPLHYQWQFNGTNLTDNVRISGSLSANLVIANVLMSDAGNYRVIVTNDYSSVTSSVASLSVVGILTNVALTSAGATAVANSEFSGNGYFPASNTIDDNFGNYWAAIQGVYPWVLTVTFADYYPIVRFNLVEDTWDPAFATSGVIEYNNARGLDDHHQFLKELARSRFYPACSRHMSASEIHRNRCLRSRGVV